MAMGTIQFSYPDLWSWLGRGDHSPNSRGDAPSAPVHTLIALFAGPALDCYADRRLTARRANSVLCFPLRRLAPPKGDSRDPVLANVLRL